MLAMEKQPLSEVLTADDEAQHANVNYAVLERLKREPADKTILDLSGQGLQVIPEEVLKFRQLEWLYLCDNQLTAIPSDLFIALPLLKYLDLRNNNLGSLPSSIGRHKHLETLLLGGNKLTALPVELGSLGTLTGLNLSDNPFLYFPPKQVLAEGVQSVLAFLRSRGGGQAFVTDLGRMDSGRIRSGASTTRSTKSPIGSPKLKPLGLGVSGSGQQMSPRSERRDQERVPKLQGSPKAVRVSGKTGDEVAHSSPLAPRKEENSAQYVKKNQEMKEEVRALKIAQPTVKNKKHQQEQREEAESRESRHYVAPQREEPDQAQLDLVQQKVAERIKSAKQARG